MGVLILCNSGINSTIYNDKKLKSLKLSASITWFDYTVDDEEEQSDNDFDFISDDEDDDEDEDDDVATHGGDKLKKMHIKVLETTTTCNKHVHMDERDDFIKETMVVTPA